jgi:flagellar protein FlaG
MASDLSTINSLHIPRLQTGPAAPVSRPKEEQAVKEEPRAAEQPEPLESIVSELNTVARELHRELQFSVDRESGETVVKVIDPETDEVVRQIPSEELMQLRKRLEQAAGVFFHDSA